MLLFKEQRRLEEEAEEYDCLTEGCVYHLHRGLESVKVVVLLGGNQGRVPYPTSGIKDLPYARALSKFSVL